MKNKNIQFYLVARKTVQGSVMCISKKSPGCKYIMSTKDYQKQIKWLSHGIYTKTPKCPRKNTAEEKEKVHQDFFP